METIEFKKKIFNLDIIPQLGNEIIFVGMPLNNLNDVLRTHFSIYGDQNNAGYCLTYWIKLDNKLKITIDILKQKVYEISFYGDYKGTYKGIGIGSTVSDLLEVRNDVYFDEQFILVGKFPYDFILKIDNDDSTIYNLDDVLENKITEITVEDKSLLH